MQVARNFFLTREKTLTRKLREVLLAWKIEANLTKDEILELYVNQIFLGQRAYGFAAAVADLFRQAAQGRHRRRGGDARRPAQGAVRRSTRSPTRNAPRRGSCTYCGACTSFEYINDAGSSRKHRTAPLAVRQGVREALPTHAEFVAEMARQVVFDAYGEDAYTKGLTVWTTMRRADQEAAYAAVRRGVLDYDRRHGYRGPEAYVEPPDGPGRARSRCSSGCSQETPDGDNLADGRRAGGQRRREVKAVLADGDVGRRSPATGSSSPPGR